MKNGNLFLPPNATAEQFERIIKSLRSGKNTDEAIADVEAIRRQLNYFVERSSLLAIEKSTLQTMLEQVRKANQDDREAGFAFIKMQRDQYEKLRLIDFLRAKLHRMITKKALHEY